MSESTPPDRKPSDPTKEASWDSATDQGLDEALTRASSLATDLVEQLGSPEPEGATASPNPLEDPRNDLDAELTQIADLTHAAAEQLADADTPASTPAAAGAEAVPDFMAEFMSPPQEASEAPTAPISEPSLKGRDVELVRSGGEAGGDPRTKGVVGGGIKVARVSGQRGKDGNAAGVGEGQDPEGGASSLSRRSLASGALAPVASSLELADKAFGWVGTRARVVVGWIAIGLLVASLVLFLRRPG